MKFDIPGRTQPTKVVRYRDGREYVFEMPHTTEDLIEIEILTSDPLTQVVLPAPPAPPKPPPAPEPEALPEAFKSPKPSRKEV